MLADTPSQYNLFSNNNPVPTSKYCIDAAGFASSKDTEVPVIN